MPEWMICWEAVGLLLLAFFSGTHCGISLEKTAWIIRADRGTPYHARGKFYYIRKEDP